MYVSILYVYVCAFIYTSKSLKNKRIWFLYVWLVCQHRYIKPSLKLVLHNLSVERHWIIKSQW